MAIPKKSTPPASPLKALPAPQDAGKTGDTPHAETQAPQRPEEPKLHWLAKTLIQGIGAFMAGCAAGYAFCKAEAKFSSFGQNLFVKAMRMVDTDGGQGGRSRWQRPAGGADRHRSGADDPSDDPMGDGGGSPFGDEGEEQL